MSWINSKHYESKNYICGYCGSDITSNIGYYGDNHEGHIRICHKCHRPSYIALNGVVTPGAPYGKKVKYLPPDVEKLYNEIQKCFSINAYTSIIMCSRKILMHVAREQGAEENLPFGKYVQYLKDEGYVTRPSFTLVETILRYGNISNHQIEEYDNKDAEIIMIFLQSILENIYELPERHKELFAK